MLLLDEPLGALDAKLRKRLQIELKALQEEVGITFIYVTHDQEEALTMSDRIAVMSQGRVEQVGPPKEIYEAPATAYVADFLGVSNLMDATAAGSGDGGCRVTLGEFDADRRRGRRRHAGDAKVTIRPERVDLEAQGTTGREPIPGDGGARRLRRLDRCRCSCTWRPARRSRRGCPEPVTSAATPVTRSRWSSRDRSRAPVHTAAGEAELRVAARRLGTPARGLIVRERSRTPSVTGTRERWRVQPSR